MIFPQTIIYKISNIGDGNMDFRFDASLTVLKNREEFFKKNAIDSSRAVCMNVMDHKDNILVIRDSDLGRGIFNINDAPLVDALVTNKLNVCLMLLTADCLPISVWDHKNNVISLVHASAKTTKLQIAKKVISLMTEEFASIPKDIKVCFAPSIKKESYFMDLEKENIKQLLELGVSVEHIFRNSIDTYKSDKYFSHRRSDDRKEKEGRFATILGFKDKLA